MNAVSRSPKAKGPAVAVPPKNVLAVDLRYIGDTPDAATAWQLTRPEVQAAATIQVFEGDNLDVNALVAELSDQVKAVNRGDLMRAEGMLIAQAHTLDELFNNLARRSHKNMTGGYAQAAETYLRLALKAQTQCRATLETLAAVKNPPVFAKQANINNGGQQQVNNGVPAHAAEKQIPEIKKLEVSDGEWLDTGATRPAIRTDQELAPVGEDQGAGHARGKGKGLSQRLHGRSLADRKGAEQAHERASAGAAPRP
jgi:hypothetical protein